MRRSTLYLSLVAALWAFPACSDSADEAATCSPEEVRNPITGACEVPLRGSEDTGVNPPGDAALDAGFDADPPDQGDADDPGTDAGDTRGGDSDDTSTPPCPDNDGDGFRDEACGGRDCDDQNAAISPGRADICDAFDNDCSGAVNDGVSCTFYAQTSSALFRVDPFQKTATRVTSVPNLFDMDTHPDGTLYGITSSSLYSFDATNDDWTAIGALGTVGTPNGLAINSAGEAFVTSSNNVYRVDLTTGQATLIGAMGGGFTSSGDCVINKDDTLYMSSDHRPGGDSLILIDTADGSGSQIGQGSFEEIYGLTSAWGRMYGLTGRGELIEINPGDGQATLVHTFSGLSWYGAASTPLR